MLTTQLAQAVTLQITPKTKHLQPASVIHRWEAPSPWLLPGENGLYAGAENLEFSFPITQCPPTASQPFTSLLKCLYIHFTTLYASRLLYLTHRGICTKIRIRFSLAFCANIEAGTKDTASALTTKKAAAWCSPPPPWDLAGGLQVSLSPPDHTCKYKHNVSSPLPGKKQCLAASHFFNVTSRLTHHPLCSAPQNRKQCCCNYSSLL